MTTSTDYPTYIQLQEDVTDPLDIEVGDDSFIKQSEMIKYCNKAIDKAEKILIQTYQDYFLTRDLLTLVDGQEAYDAPDDIYAMKIRNMVYYGSSDVFEVERMRDYKKFIKYRYEKEYYIGGSEYAYRWFLINTDPGAWQQLISPTPTGSGTIERWYIRQANRIVSTTDIMDIPEARDFIVAYMKYRCILKQQRGNNESNEISVALNEVKEEAVDLRNTLSMMIPDGGEDIEPDFSSYEEQEF